MDSGFLRSCQQNDDQEIKKVLFPVHLLIFYMEIVSDKASGPGRFSLFVVSAV